MDTIPGVSEIKIPSPQCIAKGFTGYVASLPRKAAFGSAATYLAVKAGFKTAALDTPAGGLFVAGASVGSCMISGFPKL